MKSAEKDRKLTFKEWLEHIWYYYKWQILILGLIAVFIIVATVQLFSKSEPDVGIMVVGKTALTAEGTEDFKEVCYSIMSDYNGDGEKNVNYLELTVSDEDEANAAQYNFDQTALQRFNTEVTSGNSIIYLVNEASYERLKEFGVLSKLSDVLPASAIPSETVDEYGVYLAPAGIASCRRLSASLSGQSDRLFAAFSGGGYDHLRTDDGILACQPVVLPQYV